MTSGRFFTQATNSVSSVLPLVMTPQINNLIFVLFGLFIQDRLSSMDQLHHICGFAAVAINGWLIKIFIADWIGDAVVLSRFSSQMSDISSETNTSIISSVQCKHLRLELLMSSSRKQSRFHAAFHPLDERGSCANDGAKNCLCDALADSLARMRNCAY